MKINDYYSISCRAGVALVALSSLLMANCSIHLQGVVSANGFKCIVAMLALLACFGIDIIKNNIKGRKRRERIEADRAFDMDCAKRWGA